MGIYPASKALIGLIKLEIEFLRHSHFCAIGHALVLHDGRFHCCMKHAWAPQDGDILHHAAFEHDLRFDHALRAVLQRAPRHLGRNLRWA